MCDTYEQTGNNQCYMQPVREKNTRDINEATNLLNNVAIDENDSPENGYSKLRFFDCECHQENGNHKPYA